MTLIWSRLFLVLMLTASCAAWAQQVYVHIENDILSGSDGHYTGGIELGWHAGQTALSGRDWDVVWQLKLLVFTPQDTLRFPPDPHDLPYAGVALLHWNLFSHPQKTHYDHLGVQLGWMGPSTHLGELQRAFHRAIGNREPLGWHTQLPDQPLVGVFYNRAMRLWYAPAHLMSLQAHVGGFAGNLARYVNGAVLWRWGVDAERLRAYDQILGTSASEALWQGRSGWQVDVGAQWNHYFYLALVNDRGLPLRDHLVKLLLQLQYSWRHWQLAFLMQQSQSVLADRSGEDRWGGLKLAWTFE